MASQNFHEEQLLRSALGKTAQCLPVETLSALAEHSPAAPGDAQARAHVERCAYCSNELAMLVEFQTSTPRPEEIASVAWIQSELERRSAVAPQAAPSVSLWSKLGSWISWAFPARSWQLVPVAAALLFVVGGVMYLRQGSDGLRPPAGGEQVWRSQQFAAVAPLGDVATPPAALQWATAPGASQYLVRVMEVDRTEIWRGETAGTRIAVPAEVRGQMTAGRSFLWMVTARDGAGGNLAETGLQSFHIALTTR